MAKSKKQVIYDSVASAHPGLWSLLDHYRVLGGSEYDIDKVIRETYDLTDWA